MNSQQQPAININMGKQNRVWLTVCLTVGLTVAGWVINSETVMPNLMGFYLRVRYGRELAEQMQVKTPEQIRLEALEAKLEEERGARTIMEQSRVEQQAIIEKMSKDSTAKHNAELRLAREREEASAAELERVRQVGIAKQAAKAKAAADEKYRASEEGRNAARKAEEEKQRLADEKRNPELVRLRELKAEHEALTDKRHSLWEAYKNYNDTSCEEAKIVAQAMRETELKIRKIRPAYYEFNKKVAADELRYKLGVAQP